MSSAVPPRVNLLIFHTNTNLLLTRGISLKFRGGVHLYIPLYAVGSGVYRVTHLRDLISYVCTVNHSKSKDQPGKVANPARGQLNKEN